MLAAVTPPPPGSASAVAAELAAEESGEPQVSERSPRVPAERSQSRINAVAGVQLLCIALALLAYVLGGAMTGLLVACALLILDVVLTAGILARGIEVRR